MNGILNTITLDLSITTLAQAVWASQCGDTRSPKTATGTTVHLLLNSDSWIESRANECFLPGKWFLLVWCCKGKAMCSARPGSCGRHDTAGGRPEESIGIRPDPRAASHIPAGEAGRNTSGLQVSRVSYDASSNISILLGVSTDCLQIQSLKVHLGNNINPDVYVDIWMPIPWFPPLYICVHIGPPK